MDDYVAALHDDLKLEAVRVASYVLYNGIPVGLHCTVPAELRR